MNIYYKNKKKSGPGFTLVELAIAMTVAALFAAATVPPLVEDYNRNRANLLIGEIQALSEAARLWAYDHQYTWPDQPRNCKNAIDVLKQYRYLKAMDKVTPWKSNYETSCVIPTRLTITAASHAKWARVVANSLPATEVVSLPSIEMKPDNGTITYVSFPGSLPALNKVMHRVYDPSHPELNQMETTLKMISETGIPQNIVGANQVNAVNVTAYDENPEVLNRVTAGNAVNANNYVKALTFIDSSAPLPNPNIPRPRPRPRRSGSFGGGFFRPQLSVITLPIGSLPGSELGGIADPVGTTEDISYGISRLNATKSADRNQFGLTFLDASNNQNRNPKAYSGSVNVNDIYLRSVEAPGLHNPSNPWKWASRIDLIQCNWNGWSRCNGRLYVDLLGKKKNLKGILISPIYYCLPIPGAGFGAIVAAQPGQCKAS